MTTCYWLLLANNTYKLLTVNLEFIRAVQWIFNFIEDGMNLFRYMPTDFVQ